jgi:hypothetical protein
MGIRVTVLTVWVALKVSSLRGECWRFDNRRGERDTPGVQKDKTFGRQEGPSGVSGNSGMRIPSLSSVPSATALVVRWRAQPPEEATLAQTAGWIELS